VKELLAKLAAIDAQIDEVLKAEDFNDESRKKHDDLVASRARVESQIELAKAAADRAEARQKAEADADAAAHANDMRDRTITHKRKTATDTPGNSVVHAEPKDQKLSATWGFDNFGQFAKEVYTSRVNQTHSTRIMNAFNLHGNAAATGMGEAVGSDGGFLVPPEFSSKIFERMYSPSSLISMTDTYTVQGNQITFPRLEESSRATGSRWGGVRTYWRGEGSTPTASKPTYGRFTLTLHKLISMGVMTDELIEDAGAALEQYLFRKFGEEIDFVLGDSLINGTGAGQPLGVLNSDCVVSVSKETGQSAATISATNILKMWSRLFAGCRSKCVWLINQDVEPQLNSMQIGTGVANQVVYMPPGGLSQAPYATLMGRPVMPVEFCATLGTVGDIILVDLSQWATAVKGGGPKQAVSTHLYFDRDEQAFRVTYRVDSQPWWPSALTPYKGTATQSCAVTLATRS